MEPNQTNSQELRVADSWKPDVKELPHDHWTPVGSFWMKVSSLAPNLQLSAALSNSKGSPCRSEELQKFDNTMSSWTF